MVKQILYLIVCFRYDTWILDHVYDVESLFYAKFEDCQDRQDKKKKYIK